MRQLYVGIDPGESHVGYAILDVKTTHQDRRWTLNMGVRDVAHHGFFRIIEMIGEAPQISKVSVEMIIESYQQRPVGHQSFNTALTPQFIGAFRFVAHVQDIPTFMIQPGPVDDLDRLFFTPVIKRWDPEPQTHKNWKHALSALRVIGIHLMATTPERIMDLRNAYNILGIDVGWEGDVDCSEDCTTEPVQWRTPK